MPSQHPLEMQYAINSNCDSYREMLYAERSNYHASCIDWQTDIIVKEIYKCYNNKMAYSTDYRQMILDKHEAGRSIRSLAQEFNISTRTLQNWKKQPERKVVKTRKGKIDMALLKQDVEKYPDSYQRERAVRFNCTQRAIGIALKRLKITQKKDT
jgi:transposase